MVPLAPTPGARHRGHVLRRPARLRPARRLRRAARPRRRRRRPRVRRSPRWPTPPACRRRPPRRKRRSRRRRPRRKRPSQRRRTGARARARRRRGIAARTWRAPRVGQRPLRRASGRAASGAVPAPAAHPAGLRRAARPPTSLGVLVFAAPRQARCSAIDRGPVTGRRPGHDHLAPARARGRFVSDPATSGRTCPRRIVDDGVRLSRDQMLQRSSCGNVVLFYDGAGAGRALRRAAAARQRALRLRDRGRRSGVDPRPPAWHRRRHRRGLAAPAPTVKTPTDPQLDASSPSWLARVAGVQP